MSSLNIKKIVCSNCGRVHPTDNFQLVPMIGKIKFEVNQVYLHDTGLLSVHCDCDYITRVERK